MHTGKLVLKKTAFSALESKLKMSLIKKGWYGMYFACKIWCKADVLSFSPSSEQALRLSSEMQTANAKKY